MELVHLLISICLSCLVMTTPFRPNPGLYLNNTQMYEQLVAMLKEGTVFQQVDHLLSKESCRDDPSVGYLRFGAAAAPVQILLVCGVHARELLTVDVCVEYLRRFGNNTRFLRNVRLDVFLAPNPEREKVLKGNFSIRKSSTGVDLNRNYNLNWKKGDANKNSSVYQGPFPMSEPLTHCIDILLHSRNYTGLLDVHSGEFSLYFDAEKNSEKYNSSKSLLSKIQSNFCRHCMVTTLDELNKTKSGCLYTYASEKLNVEFSFLFEVYSSDIYPKFVSADAYNFKVFNPNSALSRQFYIDKWAKAIFATFSQILDRKKQLF